MPKFNYETYKPFECDIIDRDSKLVKKVLINFGTVICTASNSLENYFIPKIENRQLKRQGEDDFIQNNTLVLNGEDGAVKGCIYLEIILNEFNKKVIIDEWKGTFLNLTVGGDTKFRNYIKKYLLPSLINTKITTNLNNYNYTDPNTGLTRKKLIKLPNSEQAILEEKENVKKAGSSYIWYEVNSSYYVLKDTRINKEGVEEVIEENGVKQYNAKPLDICFDLNLFPLINISNTIKEVSIKFVNTNNAKEIEEKLDKYNFILNNIKYIPIAWIDGDSVENLEQIVNFDYIFSFPHYFYKNGTGHSNIQIFKTLT